MSFEVQSVSWPGKRALVLVHGVGDYKKGDYNKLLTSLEAAVGAAEWKKIAVYTVFYDLLNDWVAEKLQAKKLTDKLVERLKFSFETSKLGEVAAEGVGDILWPVLELSARDTIRDLVIKQLQQVVLDGDRAGHLRRDTKISIVGHSLGCFHTFEAISACTFDPKYRMQPIADAVQFDNVILMASPVQIIRSAAGWLGRLIPDADGLYSLRNRQLELPGELNAFSRFVPATRRFVSLTGTFDPVGGYLLGNRLDWAYMNITGQESIVDEQTVLGLENSSDLRKALQDAIVSKKGLPFTVNNPHDWVGYVDRNQGMVKECLLS